MKRKQFNKYKLSNYSAFAITFLCMHSAEAKVVYTDIEPDYVLDSDWDHAMLDIDNNGSVEFSFWNISYYTFSFATTYIEKIWAGAIGDSRNEIAGVTSYHVSLKYLPYALPIGLSINSELSFQNWAYQRMAWKISFSTTSWEGEVFNIISNGGYWYPEKTDHYLGIHFVDGDEKYHYGWIRCSVLNSGRTLIIKDYAYERFVNSSIVAGDLVGVEPNIIINPVIIHTDIEGQEDNTAYVYYFDKTLYFNLQQVSNNTQYAIFNMMGSCVAFGEINGQHDEVKVNLPPSNYIIQIISGEFRSVKQLAFY